jgi:hypothetical protein
MNLLSTIFARKPAASTRSYQPGVELLEDRIVQTASPLTTTVGPLLTPMPQNLLPTVWMSANLQDPGVRNTAINLYKRDGGLTYSGMIAIFQKVAKDGTVTASELSDLRTLVANGPLLGMSPVVQNLADKTVNANPSNTQLQDQPLPASAISNDEIQPGQTGAVLTQLVEKWFEGLDHPDLATTDATHYHAVQGTLFGPNGAQDTDVQQGYLADCYFMSPLGITAKDSPATIQSMFSYEGMENGSAVWAVRFYNNGQADYVTVDDQLPASHGRVTCAGVGDTVNDPNNVLWVALAEKAYAQLAAEGWSRAYDGYTANSYSSLNYGWAHYSLAQITGLDSKVMWIASAAATQDKLTQALDAGKLIVLGSDSSGSLPYGVVSNHYYMLVGYHTNASGEVVFDLMNPYAHGYDGQRMLHLTWLELTATFSDWEDVAPPQGTPT